MLARKIAGILAIVALMGVAIFALSGCGGNIQTSKSFTFNVSTGDAVEVELDTSSGLDIQPDQSTFIIYKNDEAITRGIFLDLDAYNEYVEAAQDYPVFKHNRVRGNEGVYYEASDGETKEYNYLMKLADSNTAIALSTRTGEADATEVASLIVFTVNPED